MTRNLMITALLLATIFCATSAVAEWGDVTGVIGVKSPAENSFMAARIAVPEGQALSGIEWFHNDGNETFPNVLLMETTPGEEPQLAEGAMTLLNVSGESLAWGQAPLDTPVSSTTGWVFVVFQMPAYRERVGEGLYGGPGLGYQVGPATADTYISPDGQSWAALGKGLGLAVRPVLASMKGTAVPLASLREDGQPLEGTSPSESNPPRKTALGRPFPNPFNPRIEVPVDLGAHGQLRLTIYDTRGRLIRTLLDEPRAAGHYQIPWLGTDDQGRSVASGVYHVRMEADAVIQQERVTLLR